MIILPVLHRIRDSVPALKLVGGAQGLEEAQKSLTVLPAAFVLLARETAGENEFQVEVVQHRITVEFLVSVACKNLADATGKAAAETLQPIRHAIRQTLLNWQPEEDHDGIEFVTGEVQGFFNGVLWWGDLYRTAYIIRSDA